MGCPKRPASILNGYSSWWPCTPRRPTGYGQIRILSHGTGRFPQDKMFRVRQRLSGFGKNGFHGMRLCALLRSLGCPVHPDHHHGGGIELAVIEQR